MADCRGGPPGGRPEGECGRHAVLAAKHLVKTLAGRSVVNDVSLTLGRGETVGLLGPSGAGKTTIFRLLTGLLPPDAGEIVLDGAAVTRLPFFQRARRGLSYLPQEASIFRGLSVEKNILLVLEAHEPDVDRRHMLLDGLLADFGIAALRKASAARLSGGERRRCEIARALATEPAFVLLDEPFTGVDPIAVAEMRDLVGHLTERGIGVLITDHNVRETLAVIDRAYIIEGGRVLMHGTSGEVLADSEVRRLYLGDQFRP